MARHVGPIPDAGRIPPSSDVFIAELRSCECPVCAMTLIVHAAVGEYGDVGFTELYALARLMEAMAPVVSLAALRKHREESGS